MGGEGSGTSGDGTSSSRLAVLGPVLIDGAPAPTSRLESGLLIALGTAEGEPVADADLATALWGEPELAGRLRTLVSRTRRVIEVIDLGIEHHRHGYRLSGLLASVDSLQHLHWYRRAVELRSRNQNAETAAELETAFAHCLGSWREDPGRSLVAPESLVGIRTVRQRQLDALAGWIRAARAAGRASEVVPAVRLAVAEHPAVEELWLELVLTLHATGRDGDALSAVRAAVQAVRHHHGRDPSPALAEAERAVLGGRSRSTTPAVPTQTLPSRPPSALIERDEPWQVLARRLVDAGRGARHLVVVESPAGTGATALLESFGRAATPVASPFHAGPEASGRPTLLLLDARGPGAGSLSSALAGSGGLVPRLGGLLVVMVVTSPLEHNRRLPGVLRHRGGIDDTTSIRLAPLSPGAAARMAEDHLQALRTTADPEAVTAVVCLSGGIPKLVASAMTPDGTSAARGALDGAARELATRRASAVSGGAHRGLTRLSRVSTFSVEAFESASTLHPLDAARALDELTAEQIVVLGDRDQFEWAAPALRHAFRSTHPAPRLRRSHPPEEADHAR